MNHTIWKNYEMKMAVIAGASHALKYKYKNPKADEQEILQNVTDKIDDILKKIEEESE